MPTDGSAGSAYRCEWKFVGPVAAQIDQLMAEVGLAEPSDEIVLEGRPGVVGSERDAHVGSLAPVTRRNGLALAARED